MANLQNIRQVARPQALLLFDEVTTLTRHWLACVARASATAAAMHVGWGQNSRRARTAGRPGARWPEESFLVSVSDWT
jgi:hypothetical protein